MPAAKQVDNITGALHHAPARGVGAPTAAAIEIATSRRGYEQAGRDQEKWNPKNRDTADHSLPYITARAMLDGDISNESYAAERLGDPRVLALMSKTTVKEDQAFAASGGNAPPTRVTAVLKDGRRIAHEIDDMPGFPGKPMTRADVERKFRSNLGSRYSAGGHGRRPAGAVGARSHR